jgi:hypothetical protein
VRFLTGGEKSIPLAWSKMWREIGRWSESRTSEKIIPDSRTFQWAIICSTSPFLSEWGIVMPKFGNHYYQTFPRVSLMKCFKFRYPKCSSYSTDNLLVRTYV